MKAQNDVKAKKGKKRGWIAAVVVAGALTLGGLIGYSLLDREHTEARNLPISQINFGRLRSGTYQGDYAGGMYQWRTNEVKVTVDAGRVEDIKLLNSAEVSANSKYDYGALYDEVIQAQSLQVDTVSGSTLTTKAFLKAIENALLKAQA